MCPFCRCSSAAVFVPQEPDLVWQEHMESPLWQYCYWYSWLPRSQAIGGQWRSDWFSCKINLYGLNSGTSHTINVNVFLRTRVPNAHLGVQNAKGASSHHKRGTFPLHNPPPPPQVYIGVSAKNWPDFWVCTQKSALTLLNYPESLHVSHRWKLLQLT